MATKHDIRIPQASTWSLVITVVGGPADLSGYVGDMQIRPAKGSAELYADFTDIEVEPLNRQVILIVTDEETGALGWSGNAVYDLYVEGPTGDRWRLIEGLATLNKTVTREAS